MKNFIYLISILLFLSSCGTALHTGGDVIYPEKPMLNVPAITGKLVVDKSKVLSGTSRSTTLLMIFRTGDNTFVDARFMAPASSDIKKAAMYNALASSDNDIMVNPKYIVKKTKEFFGLFKTETVQVSGYGAKVVID